MIRKIFSLVTLITLTVFAIAGSAAYFSIYGLVLIYSGAVIPMIVMASSLEVGKLVLTSVVFNYWRNMNFLLTAYCLAAILGLMAITSVGIYGFMSAAYQTSQGPLAQVSKRIELLDAEYKRKVDRINQMDTLIQSINSDYVKQRMKEKAQQAPEREQLRKRIEEIETEKLTISSTQLDTEIHLGPIVKIAEAFNVSRDRAVHLLTLLFIFVFDPLAVALTLCVNVVINSKKKQITFTKPDPVIEVPEVVESIEETPEPIEQDLSTAIDEPVVEKLQEVIADPIVEKEPVVLDDPIEINVPKTWNRLESPGVSVSVIDTNTVKPSEIEVTSSTNQSSDIPEIELSVEQPAEPVVVEPPAPVEDSSYVFTEFGKQLDAIQSQLRKQSDLESQNALRNELVTKIQQGS
jgi:hypothetical protein